jgi:hypothetical protein
VETTATPNAALSRFVLVLWVLFTIVVSLTVVGTAPARSLSQVRGVALGPGDTFCETCLNASVEVSSDN